MQELRSGTIYEQDGSDVVHCVRVRATPNCSGRQHRMQGHGVRGGQILRDGAQARLCGDVQGLRSWEASKRDRAKPLQGLSEAGDEQQSCGDRLQPAPEGYRNEFAELCRR